MGTDPSPLDKASSSPSGENPSPIMVYEIAEYTRSSEVFFPPSPGFQRWCSCQSDVSRNSTALELRRIASSCPSGEKQGGLSSLASPDGKRLIATSVTKRRLNLWDVQSQ